MPADVLEFPILGVLERGDQIELAQRLIAEDTIQGDGERPVTDAAGAYHVWDPDATIWRALDPKTVECRVDDFAGAPVEGAKGPRPLKVKEGDAPAVARVCRRQTWRPEFFRDDLVAFDNGLVARVDDGTLYLDRLTPSHGARVMLPVAYSDEWEMPDDSMLAHYLTTTFGDVDEQAIAIELMGAALMGIGARMKKAWFLTDGPDVDGRGGTGKSQLLELLAGLVPRERQCSIAPQDFAHEYHGADLFGKTLNVVFEAPDTDILREEGVKAIIHGETIRRRRIRQDPIEFRPSALHVFAVNRLPDAPGASGAFWDRWNVLEFNNRFRNSASAIPNIGEQILEREFVDLVHLALRGANRLLRAGGYTRASSCADAVERWRLTADPVAAFIAERCEPAETEVAAEWIAASALYDEYRQWCGARGHSPCSMQKFGRRIPGDVEKARSMGASRYRLRIADRARPSWEF